MEADNTRPSRRTKDRRTGDPSTPHNKMRRHAEPGKDACDHSFAFIAASSAVNDAEAIADKSYWIG